MLCVEGSFHTSALAGDFDLDAYSCDGLFARILRGNRRTNPLQAPAY
jgi:hypothetical protein